MQIKLSTLATLLGCEQPLKDVEITGAVIDSRKITVSDLFVALKGEHVDGHDYIETARLAGASAALVSEKQHSELPQLVVDNVVAAFAKIATYWCKQSSAKIVAITGSNGKTTLKELTASILRQCGSVVSTQGNLNNELGVPLTLCRLKSDTDFAVIEMGANHPGEIAQLVKMAEPDIAIINNVGAAHIEGFGSIEGVAKAKAEIFSQLDADGIGVLNADMPFLDGWKKNELAGKKVITFALDAEADITAKECELDTKTSQFKVKLDEGLYTIHLPLPGRHNIANALAAIAITQSLAVPHDAIVTGLSEMKGVQHRLQMRDGLNGCQLIDDTYNANPNSYQQALAALASFSGERWLVLGDFGELGDDAEQIHIQMGIDAKKAGVDKLWTVGDQAQLAAQSFGEHAQHFSSIEAVQARLKSSLTANVTCLIKGSRFMQLDKLADQLTTEGEG